MPPSGTAAIDSYGCRRLGLRQLIPRCRQLVIKLPQMVTAAFGWIKFRERVGGSNPGELEPSVLSPTLANSAGETEFEVQQPLSIPVDCSSNPSIANDEADQLGDLTATEVRKEIGNELSLFPLRGGRGKWGKKALARNFIQPNAVVVVCGNLIHQLPLLPSAAFETNCRCSHFRHFI